MNESDNSRNERVPTAYESRRDSGQDDEIDLAQLWSVLVAGKWNIIACVVAALILAVIYLFVVTPTYQADALLQIRTEQASPMQGFASQLGLGGQGNIADAETQIIGSRSVLGETVRKLHLDINVAPKYFPLIGHAIARRSEADPAAKNVAKAGGIGWFPDYAWQPTNVQITRFDAPEDVRGEPFTLRALGGGQYALYGPEGNKLLLGQVGKPASAQLPEGGKVSLFVQQLDVGSPPTDFSVSRTPWLLATDDLSNALNVTQQGQDTSILALTLQGHDRAHITQVVNSVADTYLKKNVEAHSEQAEKSLDFLQQQLPKLKENVELAESKLADYQKKSGEVVDLTQTGQALLGREVDLQKQIEQVKMKMAEMRQLYSGQHPRLKALRQQKAQLEAQQKSLDARMGTLPDKEKELLKLQRDVKVRTGLYVELMNRTQELSIMKAGTVGDVRIVDHAVEPVKPVAPRKKLVLLLALVLGAFIGAGWTFLRMALRRVVDDPNEVERQLGLPIYAVVPYSGWLERQSRQVRRRGGVMPLLARDHSDDVSVESLRSLRTSLYFAQMEGGSNSILVTGPAPGVGKSFVSANLGYVLAENDQRVVIVDADMRRGQLHNYLDDGKREPGLSQVVTGQVKLADALRSMGSPNVQLLSTGQIPPNPVELLMSEAFANVLAQLKQEFDMVIVDAPPIMAVTDATVIAGVDPKIITFLVARAGTHPMEEIEESAKRLARQNTKVAGVIFNAYKKSHATAAGGYNYYQYEYKSRS